MDFAEIITGAIAVGGFAYGYFQKKKKDQAKRQMQRVKVELSALTVFFESDFYSFLETRVNEIFERTQAIRFLILYAVNGKEEFNYATVAYEHTKDERTSGAIRRYIRIEVDSHYKNLLKRVEEQRSVVLEVDNMGKNSLLYNIYSSDQERVKHSVVKFLARKPVDQDNDVLFYCSIATCNETPFTNEELTEMRLAVDTIRGRAGTLKIEQKI